MIGVMVPSAFALSYDTIMIKDPDGDNKRVMLSTNISLDGDFLAVTCGLDFQSNLGYGAGDICIFDINSGKMKKIIRAESFNEYSIIKFSNVIIQGNTLFALFSFDITDPSYVCPRGIAMIDMNTNNLLKIFTDEQLSANYGHAHNFKPVYKILDQACSESWGNFRVFENYLLVGAPSTHDRNTKHPDFYGIDVIQKSKVFLYDITTGNLLHTFEDLDSDLHPIEVSSSCWDSNTNCQYTSHDETFTKLGAGRMAISEDFIVITDRGNAISATPVGAAHVYDTKTRNHLYTFQNPTPLFGSGSTISGDNIFVSDPKNGKVDQFSGTTGKLIRTFDSPNNKVGFGFDIDSSGNLLLVSERSLTCCSIGKAFLYDISTGELVKELKNADPEPGHFEGPYFFGDQYGTTVSFSGDKFAISAPEFLNYPIFAYVPIDSSKVTPIISVPDNITMSGKEPTGSANIEYTVTAKDYQGRIIDVTCNPSSGSLFLEGTEIVTCTATDSGGNSATSTFNITISTSSIPEPVAEPAVTQESIQKVPDWVRNIFIWYAEERISEDELLNAIKFLVNQGIINLNE